MKTKVENMLKLTSTISKPFCRQCLPKQIHRFIKTGYPQADKVLEKATGGRIDHWIKLWENFIGLTPVKEAQAVVIKTNEMLRNAREERRVLQQQRTGVQKRLKEVALKVEKTPRGTDQYVDLVREESKIFQEDNLIAEKVIDVEERERQSFESLTHAIYLAHEKENEQREHTKYYSIIASLIGAIIGAVMAYGRLRSVNKAMESSDDTVQECRVILTDMQSQQRDMQTLITNVRQYLNTAGSSNTDQDATQQMSSVSSQKENYDNVSVVDKEMKENIKDILTAVKENGSNLDKDMKEIRKILEVGSAKDSSGTVVYVGPEIKELLDETGKNMESKLKIYTLASVTFIYGTLALTVPILYHFFKGS